MYSFSLARAMYSFCQSFGTPLFTGISGNVAPRFVRNLPRVLCGTLKNGRKPFIYRGFAFPGTAFFAEICPAFCAEREKPR